MNLRTKVVLILAGMWIIIFSVFYAGANYFFSSRLRELEKSEVLLDTDRAVQSFDNIGQSLDTLTGDWGNWNESYNFYSEKNQKFIDNNFQAQTFGNANVNFIVYFDLDGKIFYGKSYDIDKKNFIPVPDSLVKTALYGPFKNILKQKKSQSGLMSLPEGLLTFSVSPVVKSDGTGEPRGMLFMGFYLNQSHIDALAKMVRMPVYFTPLPVKSTSTLLYRGDEQLRKEGAVLTFYLPEKSSKYAFGFAKINDYTGKPVALLGVKVLRTLALQSFSEFLLYLSLFVILAVVALMLVWYLLKVFVLDRITSIVQQLARISSGSVFSERIRISGQDELKGMVNAINSMLEIIELSEDQLKSRIANRTGQLVHLSELNKNLFDEVNRQKSIEENMREHEKSLKKFAYYDQLTGLPNRLFFREQVQKFLERAEKSGAGVVIMFLDADKFKHINDAYGHAVGDEFLVHVAANLKKIIKDSDMIARYAGDEFVVFMNNIRGHSIISHMAEKILREASQPFVRDNISIHSTFSLGISIYPNDGKTISELEHSADLAMYHAKKKNGNIYCFAGTPEESFTIPASSVE